MRFWLDTILLLSLLLLSLMRLPRALFLPYICLVLHHPPTCFSFASFYHIQFVTHSLSDYFLIRKSVTFRVTHNILLGSVAMSDLGLSFAFQFIFVSAPLNNTIDPSVPRLPSSSALALSPPLPSSPPDIDRLEVYQSHQAR